jgi:hypothetical protein
MSVPAITQFSCGGLPLYVSAIAKQQDTKGRRNEGVCDD